MFGKGNSREQAEKKMKKAVAKQTKLWNKKIEEAMSWANCEADLNICKNRFEATIVMEQNRLKERAAEGKPVDRQKERLKHAAIGVLITEDALDELADMRAEGDLTSTLNSLCLALKQMERISDHGAKLKATSLGAQLAVLYPSESKLAKKLEALEIPDRISDAVNETFVNNLASGMSLRECRTSKNIGIGIENAGVDQDIMDVINEAPEEVGGGRHFMTEDLPD